MNQNDPKTMRAFAWVQISMASLVIAFVGYQFYSNGCRTEKLNITLLVIFGVNLLMGIGNLVKIARNKKAGQIITKD